MTTGISGVANNTNSNSYDSNVKTAAGQVFSSVLQAKMNSSTMSIANFDNINDTTNSSNSLFSNSLNGQRGGLGTSGNSLMSSSLMGLTGGLGGSTGTSLLGSLGGGTQSSSSGISGDTLVTLLFLMLAMNTSGGDGSSAMLSSLTSALTGNSPYSSFSSNASSLYNGLSLEGSSYKSTPVTKGTGSYPSSMGYACSPSVVSNVGARSAALYNNVIKQFNVEGNSRYTPYKNGSTYCNIYVWDVTTAMGAEIPHRVDANGDIVKKGSSVAKYMTANAMYDWLGGKGQEYGWKEVSAQEAQMYANMGSPAVASWKNPKGHGHIQMVVPSKDGGYNQEKGVAISQAGSKVIEYGHISDVYKSSRLSDIKYFVHP